MVFVTDMTEQNVESVVVQAEVVPCRSRSVFMRKMLTKPVSGCCCSSVMS